MLMIRESGESENSDSSDGLVTRLDLTRKTSSQRRDWMGFGHSTTASVAATAVATTRRRWSLPSLFSRAF